MKPALSIHDHVSVCIDEDTGVTVLVDSFDNRVFSVRAGTLEESVCLGTVLAENDEELNARVHALLKRYPGLERQGSG